jgi:hypothetical protein
MDHDASIDFTPEISQKSFFIRLCRTCLKQK